MNPKYDVDDDDEFDPTATMTEITATLTHDLDSTIRSMKALSEKPGRAPEYRNFVLRAVDQLTDEVKGMRAAAAATAIAVNSKASAGALAKLSLKLSAQIDARFDRTRNLVLAAASILGVLIAAFGFFRK